MISSSIKGIAPLSASNFPIIPIYGITSGNVQGALTELQSNKANSADVYTKTESETRYAPCGYGLGTTATTIDDADLAMKGGCYKCATGIHCPTNDDYYFISVNGGWDGANITQTATGLETGMYYIRKRQNDAWSVWRQLAFTDNPVFSGCVGIGGASSSPNNALTIVGSDKRIALDDRVSENRKTFVLEPPGFSYAATAKIDTYDYAAGAGLPLAINPNGGRVAIGHYAPKATLHSTGSTILGVATGVGWADVGNRQMNIEVNEASNTLVFGIKLSTGLNKTVQINYNTGAVHIG